MCACMYYVSCSAGLIKVILMVSCYTQWSHVITRIHYEAIIIIYFKEISADKSDVTVSRHHIDV